LYFSYLEEGRQQDAEQTLTAKARNNPEDIASRLQLCRHYLRLKNQPALTATEEELTRVAGTKAAQVRLDLGDLHAEFGDRDAAMKFYGQAEAADAERWGVCEKKIAATLLAAGNREQARARLDSLLQRDPADTDARCARGILLADGKRPADVDAAIAEFQQIVQRKPNSAAYRFYLGRAYGVKGDWQSSRRELLLAINLDSKYAPALLAYAI
jgi:tetratricopeptide (TPR) repeat protein